MNRKLVILACLLLALIFSMISEANNENLDSGRKFQLELAEIGGFYRDKAGQRFQVSSENVKLSLEHLRKLLKGEKSLYFPLDNDQMLIKFLRYDKFDAIRTFEQIKKYYNFKLKFNKVFKNLTPSSAKEVYQNEIVQVMTDRDLNGRRVIVVHAGRWNPSKMSKINLFRGVVVMVEMLLLEPETQFNGVTIVLNVDDLSFSQILEASPSFLSMAFEFGQDALPVHIGQIYVVNNSFLFNILFQIIKPFLSKDLSQRINFENSNFKKMASQIGENTLEKKFGGNLKDNIPFGKIMIQEAIKYDNFFVEMEKFGYKNK